ncbi:hypothetical protein [Spirabiliibacterium falconis]|uniref:hypothetical protein n=1 Tax=Spirabiliibacterium falconis TaxID=572023 RepID=UPI001AACC2E5|nr:hypothetical protein [Spirabiliibacterium falconis]MBE2894413.1 hypothetical protein [Spirabiliibacterium falconis]
MEIHGISIEKIKALSAEAWARLDAQTKQEYELILSYQALLPDDFIDKKRDDGMWESDFLVEYTCT